MGKNTYTCLGLLIFITKKNYEGQKRMTFYLWFLLILNVFIGVLGQFLLKNALILSPLNLNNISDGLFELLLSWRVIAAIACYFINLLLYLVLLSQLKLGYVFAMQVSLAIVAVTLTGFIFFGEGIQLNALIGLLLIISGIIMLNI